MPERTDEGDLNDGVFRRTKKDGAPFVVPSRVRVFGASSCDRLCVGPRVVVMGLSCVFVCPRVLSIVHHPLLPPRVRRGP